MVYDKQIHNIIHKTIPHHGLKYCRLCIHCVIIENQLVFWYRATFIESRKFGQTNYEMGVFLRKDNINYPFHFKTKIVMLWFMGLKRFLSLRKVHEGVHCNLNSSTTGLYVRTQLESKVDVITVD